jgi:hypothetical protein
MLDIRGEVVGNHGFWGPRNPEYSENRLTGARYVIAAWAGCCLYPQLEA